jgi:hypothetical protein
MYVLWAVLFRQLPNETRLFTQVDRSWTDIMRRAADRPNALRAATAPGKASTCSLSSPPCMLNVFIKEYRVYKVYKKVHYCKIVIKLKTPLNVRRSYVNMGVL